MYGKIDTLDDKLQKVIVKMKAPEPHLQKDNNSEVPAIISKLQTKNEKRNSKHCWKSKKSRGKASESDGSSSESENHRRRHTHECYRCHMVEHIARYSPNTAMMESAVPTETTAEITTTTIENYWMKVTGESPDKERWYLDCAITRHNCGYRRMFERFTHHIKPDEQQI
jgi:hypothetical protein